MFATLTALSQAATFTTLDFTTLELSATDTVNSTASVIDFVADTITTSYTFVSDYDGQGGDDTLSFDVIATYSSTTDGAQFGVGTALNYNIGLGQTITFSIDNLLYTRANGLSNSVIFNGFYEVSVGGPLSGNFSSITTGDTYLGLAGTLNAITLNTYHSSLDLTLDTLFDLSALDPNVALISGSKVLRRPDANFSLENTIPEPTTATLLGVVALVLLSFRHRNT